MAKRILILFFLAGVWIAPEDLSSCGPFLTETVFTSQLGPLDDARYFGGNLEIVQPHYMRIYLMAAYRYLAGVGLTPEDRQALLAKPAGQGFWFDQESPALNAWLRARVTAGGPPLAGIDRFKSYGQNTYILNCGDDAFHNAAQTLVERSRAGASHEDLRAWVAAQDQVFANCSAPPPREPPAVSSIPPALEAGAPPWMQADRAYQIAAAKFYASQFDAACADFLRIAADRSSPWHSLAPYLAARALIRKATLVDAGATPSARELLQKVLADPEAAAWHASARGLLRYLRWQTEPGPVLNELAREVATEKTGVAGAMNDYRIMLDRFENRQQNAPRDEDITDWIATMQQGPVGHGLEKWRETHKLPWLVAALTWASQPDAETMAAAASVARSSPAYLTVRFHRLRLMPAADARPRLDAMLRRKMPDSARNMFLAARMRIARNWDDLLRDAARTEVADYVEGQGASAASSSHRYFDQDGALILDRQAPLAVLQQAAQSPSLPPNLRLLVARSVWVRSVLTGDTKTAVEIAHVLGALSTELKPYLDLYAAAPDDKARAFAAAWLLLNNPGMRPQIDAGAGRVRAVHKLDNLRDNWWRAGGAEQPELPDAPLALLYQRSLPEAAFRSPAERAAAKKQSENLAAAPAATTFMARQAVEWAGAHPDDARVPEALRLAVRAGHFASGGDGQTDRWVKRAFHLLHARYPKSEAARRTPYWYKAGNSGLN